jgi:hypothetical protein
MKRTGLEKKTSSSRNTSTRNAARRFVVCVKSGGHVDLEPLKLYELLPDARAKLDGLMRVVDDSGEDYLYPAEFFQPIRVPKGLLAMVERNV